MEDEATQPGTTLSFDPAFLSPFPAPFTSVPIQSRDPLTYDTFLEATQLVIDPRRLGQGNSGLNDEDLADICCILHPASIPAHEAATDVHKANPRYTITTDSNVRIHEKSSEEQGFLGASGDELKPPSSASYDIVLRLSAKLKDPVGGWHFGRNGQRCDYVIGQQSESRRISNVHFRIYINEYGIIMLEDQSTNGTAVDGTLLRGKDKAQGKDYRHTLEQGSIVVLTMVAPEIDYRFHVRIPQRDQEAEEMYNRNLTAFFLRMNTVRAENETRAATGGNREPLNLFPTGIATPKPASMTSVCKSVREWKGGSKYNKVGTIGKGAFAVVFKLTAKFDGVPYAAKELEKRRFMKNGILDQKVDMEMKIMRKIKHANVVQYIEHVDWEEYLYIIMEFVPGGDLGTLVNQSGKLSEANVRLMASQLLSALRYLHDLGITHRDVKPDNILIYSRDPFHVKLTDFGLSKMIDSEETFLRTFCGTLLYCAPEVYSEYREYDLATGHRNLRGIDKRALPPQRYGHAVDIWSLAGVLFYALCGSPPYPVKNGTSYQELLNQIMTQPLDIRPLQRANISDCGIRFVRRMLHTRPDHRATIEELEQSAWLAGEDDDMQFSGETDEVEMSNPLDPGLEESASQLSIRSPKHRQHIQGDVDENKTNSPQRFEIPSSFSTDEESNISCSDVYGLPTQNGNRNARLFGEVNISDIGSSGAIPSDRLDLPLPTPYATRYTSNLSQQTVSTEQEFQVEPLSMANNPKDILATADMAPPPRPPNTIPKNSTSQLERQAARSSSLSGAESMVGHMNMDSPSPISAVSPPASSPLATTEQVIEPAVSHRRGRDEFETLDDDTLWRPADLPPKRRRRSVREIEMEIPQKAFWDPFDKSTHHYNYPRMMLSDYTNYEEYCKERGEDFRHGFKVFDTTMASFRSSRSPSLEPVGRAYSEPTKDEGRRMMLKRDERKIAGEAQPVVNSGFHAPNGFHANSPDSGSTAANSPQPDPQPLVGNDFQPPKRILAKIIATPDSCLPTVTFNLTEPVTSWGRGYDNTIRYVHAEEDRIPKYAFKIIMFKPSFYRRIQSVTQGVKKWDSSEKDMRFYISTKARSGIWINNECLPSTDPQNPKTKSKHWGEIRHGDMITVWFHRFKRDLFTRFRFECFWGFSQEVRSGGDDDLFETLPPGEYLTEIEESCLREEEAILREQERLSEKEKIAMRDEKQRDKVIQERAKSNPRFPNRSSDIILKPN